LEKYNVYETFLSKNGLLKPQIRFEEKDIQILMDIENRMDTGELIEIRDQIIQAEETVRGVSQMFFKNEKYLEKSQALINAVKQLLHIKELADEKDQQYKYVLECDNPNCIVLCENLDFLKRPTVPRKHNIELWYAGGKNVNKLEFSDTRGLPIYYSCDWDYDGLYVIYPLVKEKIPDIKLLYPDGKPQEIEKTEHKSLWKEDFDLQIFEEREQELIRELKSNKQWIVEESNSLVKMLQSFL